MQAFSPQPGDRSLPLLPEQFFFAAGLALLSLAFFLARRGYDYELLLATYPGAHSKFVGFWKLVTLFGSNQTLIPVVVFFSLRQAWRRQQEAALWLVLGWGMTTLTVELVKWLVGRGRPPLPFLTSAGGASFPSSHAAESVYVFLYLWTLLASSPTRREHNILGNSFREFCSILLVVLPAIVGYSRVYLGVHWPSDVLGGWAIGFFILGIALLSTSQEKEAAAYADK